jgi:hypothetical protein
MDAGMSRPFPIRKTRMAFRTRRMIVGRYAYVLGRAGR